MVKENPTQSINISFNEYIKNRKVLTESHMEGGIPNYAYGNDFVLRQKIKAIPGMYKLAKAITSSFVPIYKQKLNLNSLKVGPSQFPDVYKHVTDCARILGIGIPMVFIENDTNINGYTIATEDDAPLIVITSGLLERFTPGELKYVIGHECGHIHNNHGVFNLAAMIIIGTIGVTAGFVIPDFILNLLSIPLKLALQAWSRAGEVSSDRAGLICADDANDGITATSKFLYGATFNRNEVNIEAVLKQYEAIKSAPVRFLELGSTHPVPVRRIFAMKEFMNSEVLYKWRPEWKQPGMTLISKQELDMRCEKYISVTKKK